MCGKVWNCFKKELKITPFTCETIGGEPCQRKEVRK